MTKHTPWKWEKGNQGHMGSLDGPPEEGHAPYIYETKNDFVVAICPDVTYKVEPENEYDDGLRYFGDANDRAEFITRACNAHHELMWACERMWALLDAGCGRFTIAEQDRVKAAIAKGQAE